jgi:hypothetical protein
VPGPQPNRNKQRRLLARKTSFLSDYEDGPVFAGSRRSVVGL